MNDMSRGKPGVGPVPPGRGQAGEPLPDPVELSRQITEVAEKSRHLVAEFLKRQRVDDGLGMANPLSIGAAISWRQYRAADRTAGRRPALSRRGLDGQHAIRLHQAELSPDGALDPRG